MKECRDVEGLMTPFVDGEAATVDHAAVEAHLDACGRCRDLVTVERAARDVLLARRGDLRGAAPDALHSRCAAHAAWNRHAGRAMPVLRRWLPLSVAATALLAVAVVFGLGLNNKVQALAVQMTLDHVKCTRFAKTSSPVDAASAGQQWAATYGWPLRVPASSSSTGLELRAVRRCAVTDGRVAHLMYRWRGEPLSIYVLPEQVAGDAEHVVQRFSHNSVVWSQNGRTYVVLARAPQRQELDHVVRYVKANVY
ncbi:MAG: zf-HC2 domain-containing protein [Vicinamibacterales bacterium]